MSSHGIKKKIISLHAEIMRDQNQIDSNRNNFEKEMQKWGTKKKIKKKSS